MKKNHVIFVAVLLCCCGDLLEHDIREEHVTIIAPQDGVSVQEGAITFAWNELEGAQSYHFTLVSPSFANTVSLVHDTIIPNDTTGRALSVNVPLSRGSYQWKVTALNSSYHSASRTINLKVLGTQIQEE